MVLQSHHRPAAGVVAAARETWHKAGGWGERQTPGDTEPVAFSSLQPEAYSVCRNAACVLPPEPH